MPKLGERDRERLALFIDEMVAQRTHRGWSQADLAQKATYSKSLIAAVETYERPPTKELAVALDQAFVLPQTFVRLHGKIRTASFPAAFGEFAVYEGRARTLLIFEHAYLPGFCQTEAYAYAVLSHHFNVSQGEVKERLAARLARRDILERADPSPPVVWILLDEFVLHREIGGPEIMAEQLADLAEVAELPHVTVQIIPRAVGAHPGLAGTFYVAEFDDTASIVYSEDITDGKISDDPAAIADVTERYRHLASLALPADLSLALIREAQKTWSRTAPGASRLTAVPTAADASK